MRIRSRREEPEGARESVGITAAREYADLPPPRQYPEKARLIEEADFRNMLVFHLYPESIRYVRGVDYDESVTGDDKQPLVEYTGMKPWRLALRVMFNDIGHPHPVQRKTEESLEWLAAMANPAGSPPSPPLLLFVWGERKPVPVVIGDIEVEMTQIDVKTGRTLRATVDLNLILTSRTQPTEPTDAERPKRSIPPPIRAEAP